MLMTGVIRAYALRQMTACHNRAHPPRGPLPRVVGSRRGKALQERTLHLVTGQGRPRLALWADS